MFLHELHKYTLSVGFLSIFTSKSTVRYVTEYPLIIMRFHLHMINKVMVVCIITYFSVSKLRLSSQQLNMMKLVMLFSNELNCGFCVFTSLVRTLQKCCCIRVGSSKNTLLLKDQHSPIDIFNKSKQHNLPDLSRGGKFGEIGDTSYKL